MLGVVGQGRGGPLLATHHADHLATELVARGAVQEEVDGVIDVHEQLGHREDQLQLGHAGHVGGGLAVPEGGGDDADVHGEGGEQEGEGHRQQHHRQPEVGVAGEAAVGRRGRRSGCGGGRRSGGHVVFVVEVVVVLEVGVGEGEVEGLSLRHGQERFGAVVVVVVVIVVVVVVIVVTVIAVVAAAAVAMGAVDAAVAGAALEVYQGVVTATATTATPTTTATATTTDKFPPRAASQGAVLQRLSPAGGSEDVDDDEDVKDEDDDKRTKAVQHGVHPGPHSGDEELVTFLTAALGTVSLTCSATTTKI